MSGNTIPKVIHYCWFGRNPKPELAEKCIESWKKFCPDYEIKEWNEDNFDVAMYDYSREAYEAKKWAFVSDVARLYALVNEGGIYMDTDVELIKPLDPLLGYDAVSGFESYDRILTSLMACRKNQPFFSLLLKDYENRHFIKEDGSPDLTTNVARITELCLERGLELNNTKQTVDGFTLLPSDYLCPKDYETLKVSLTENTLCIHHFNGSWLSDEEKYYAAASQKLRRCLPKKLASRLARAACICKYHGFAEMIKETLRWLRRR